LKFLKDKEAAEFIAWARARAIHLDPLDGRSIDPSRLAALDRAVSGKRIAFIGEQDHYVHEKYDYRALMVRYLFSRRWRWFGEEMGFSDGLEVQRYVASGDARHLDRVTMYGDRSCVRGDRDDSPSGILKPSPSSPFPEREFKAEQIRLVRTLHELSTGAGDPLRFFGFDCDPVPGGGYRDIEAVLRPVAGDAIVRGLLERLARVAGESIEDEIARLRAVCAAIDENSTHLRELVGAHAFDELQLSARCLADSFEFIRVANPAKSWDVLNDSFAHREQVMHRQMQALLSMAPAGAKFALMSHNIHLAKDNLAIKLPGGAGPGGNRLPSIGTFLERLLPGEVFSIWMLCGRGTDAQPYAGLTREVIAPRGSLNDALCEVGPAFVLLLDDPLPQLLGREIDFVTNGNLVSRAVVPRQTDAIFFVRDVTPLRE
jgi:erythromycin esterase-like protein